MSFQAFDYGLYCEEKGEQGLAAERCCKKITFHSEVFCKGAMTIQKCRKNIRCGKTARKYCQGSVTVEACLVVPIFFLVLFSLFYLFEVLNLQRSLIEELSECGRKYEAYGVKVPTVMTEDQKIRFLQWDVSEDVGTCSCVWKEEIPVFGRWFVIHGKQSVPVRAYTGVSMVGDESDEEGVVYVTGNGTVYHEDIMCTYLKLGIQEVSYARVGQLRNRSGAIYKSCERCMKGQQQLLQSDKLYITPYGDKYHKVKTCQGLKRTIREVPRSQIGNLPPCSKCGKTKGNGTSTK